MDKLDLQEEQYKLCNINQTITKTVNITNCEKPL